MEGHCHLNFDFVLVAEGDCPPMFLSATGVFSLKCKYLFFVFQTSTSCIFNTFCVVIVLDLILFLTYSSEPLWRSKSADDPGPHTTRVVGGPLAQH